MAPGDDLDWDRFVSDQAEGTFCHHSRWAGLLQDTMGHQPHFLMARDGEGAVQGVLPLVRVTSRIFGDFLVSMPFLNDGGPLGSPVAREMLVEEAVTLARNLGVDLLEIRSRVEVPGPVEDASRKVTVLLELPDDPVALMDSFRAKVRSQVRRPMKEGMEVRFGADQLAPFYRVFARNMRDLGTPVLPVRFFRALLEAFPREAQVGVVYHGSLPVAAGFGFSWGGEFEMTWASALREYSTMAPNMLLYWGFMERCIVEGDRVFNFGRCTPGAGTHRFKLQWGGYDLPLPWASWAPGGVTTTPTPSGAFQLAVRVWQRLPVPLANRIGPLVSTRIP